MMHRSNIGSIATILIAGAMIDPRSMRLVGLPVRKATPADYVRPDKPEADKRIAKAKGRPSALVVRSIFANARSAAASLGNKRQQERRSW